MRRRIEKSPNETAKSTEAVEWVGENGEPTKITPTHRYPVARDQYRLREDKRSLLAVSSFIVILGAATLIATHFSAGIAAHVTRYAGHEVMRITEQESRLANQGSRKSNLVAQRQVEADHASAPAEAQQAAQVQQIAAVSVPEAQAAKSARSLEEEREKAAAFAQEAAAARNELAAGTEQRRQMVSEQRDRSAVASELATAQRNVETQVVQSNKTANDAAQLKKAADTAASELQRERERAEALASELAKVRREVETAAAVSSQKDDEAAQQKQTAEAAIADLQQLLQQEQKKAAALTQEVGAARRAITANAEQQHRALDEAQTRAAALASELAGTHREIETQATQSQKAVDEAVQQKQTVEAAIADLQPSMRHDGDRTEAMARDFASVPRTMDGRVAAGRSADSVVHATPVAKAAATEPLKAAEAQGSAESAKLIARARVLLSQGNIGAARIVLERAAESGNAQASFMLAETYDPVILSAWGTYGTRGEVARAREHYAKAQTGGIREAKERLDALRQ